MESFSKKQNLLKITVPQNESLSVETLPVEILPVGTLPVESLPVEILSEECQEFLNSLDDKHLKSYFIAKSHLGSSFDLEKSNSFLKWKKNRHLAT
jgi:hypothetical protein